MLRRWLGISLWVICQAHVALTDEHFNEGLHIRPLQDGRLYTHFSFQTLLTGAVPRSPATLNVDDERELALTDIPACAHVLYLSSTLHSTSVGPWPDNS